jgi:hypothetical protein
MDSQNKEFHDVYSKKEQDWCKTKVENFPDNVLFTIICNSVSGNATLDDEKLKILHQYVQHILKGCKMQQCKPIHERFAKVVKDPRFRVLVKEHNQVNNVATVDVTCPTTPPPKKKFFSTLHDVDISKITEVIQAAANSLQSCECSIQQLTAQLEQCDNSLDTLLKSMQNPITLFFLRCKELPDAEDETIRVMVRKEINMVVSEIEDSKRKKALLANLREHLLLRKSVLCHNIDHLKFLIVQKIDMINSPTKNATLENVVNVYNKYSKKRKRDEEEILNPKVKVIQQQDEACNTLLSLAANALHKD